MEQKNTTNKDVVVSITHLRKVYRLGAERVIALNDVSLDVYQGEICCLIGTSGSGKSTLLNMMAGLEKPTRGSILIDGIHVEKLNESKLAVFRQKHLGFVFQTYNLLPMMTAVENVGMPLMFQGVSQRKRNQKAVEMLTAVGLGGRLRHKPTQMSGGQQQRVAIARAFAPSPDIIFADEPTGNLDSATTVDVMELIVTLTRDNHQTLIIVTHDPDIALYADRIVHITDGCIDSITENTHKREVRSPEEIRRANESLQKEGTEK